MTSRLLSPTAMAVLRALAMGSRYGFDLIDATGLPSGTVYPVLARLEDQGLVMSRWEPKREARRAKRPQRRYYELTARGRDALIAAAERYRALARAASTTVRLVRSEEPEPT